MNKKIPSDLKTRVDKILLALDGLTYCQAEIALKIVKGEIEMKSVYKYGGLTADFLKQFDCED